MFIRNHFYALQGPDELGGTGGGGDVGSPDFGSGPDSGSGAPESSGPTIEDTARETYRSLMGDNAGDDDSTDVDTKPKKQTTQPRVNGKFAKGEQPPTATDETTTEGVEPPQDLTAQPKAHDALPNTWKKDLAAKWATVDPEVREHIYKREQDFHNGVRQYKDAAGFGASIAQEFMPYAQVMKQRGVTPQAAVRDIMGSLNTIVTGNDESKAGVLLQLAQQYGINLDTVMQLRTRAPSGQSTEIPAAVQQRIEKLEGRLTQADRERAQAEEAEDARVVNSFLNDPKNEHARTVAKEMAALLSAGVVETMQEAYDKAIWQHPEVRAKLLQKQEAERRQKEAEQATAARKATAVNVTRRGTPPAAAKPGSMDDSARSVYRKHMGG